VTGARTARARLERLLHVLPAAHQPGGARISDLARTLDTSEATIIEDIEEVTDRAYYHPGGWLDDVQIRLEPDRVTVLRADGFERPPRLTPEETLCMALALRASVASARVPEAEVRERLLERAERYLANHAWQGEGAPPLRTPDRDPDPEGIREVLISAARARRPCAISYVKSGADDAKVRVVHPYGVVYGEGSWYAVAHCTLEDGVRVFRTDRIVAADLADGSFEVPPGFDATAYVSGGRVFRAADEREVRVRYGARIARWIRERAYWSEDDIEEMPDGGVVVRHRVADPRWAVSHTLRYGADAEILEPEDLRALALDTVTGILRSTEAD